MVAIGTASGKQNCESNKELEKESWQQNSRCCFHGFYQKLLIAYLMI